LVGYVKGVLEGSQSVRILLFLHRQSGPKMTKDIMEALRIKNWSTATGMLRRLEEAKLVRLEEVSVGRYKSRAKLWRIEPHFGARVAAALEEVQRLSTEAAVFHQLPTTGRPGILDVESSGERLVLIVQNAIRTATGKG